MFNARPFHVGFVVDEVALGQVYGQVRQFSCQYHFIGAPCSFISLHQFDNIIDNT
jgi:hypothetical protein